MASDNPAMPSPVPLGPGANADGQDGAKSNLPAVASAAASAAKAKSQELAQAASDAAAKAKAAAAEAAEAASSTLQRGAQVAIPALQNLNLAQFLRDGLQNPAIKKVVPIMMVLFLLIAFVGLFNVIFSMVSSSSSEQEKPYQRAVMPGLSDADQQLALDALRAAAFDPKVDPSTGSITVDSRKFYEARIFLASKGIPKAPVPTGIDALGSQNAMTTSQFMEQVRYIKAMETELAMTITEIATIQAARVHLALPKQSVFVRDRAEPKASVVVTPQQGRIVSRPQVDAIVHLVSSSVPYLAATNVSVVDNFGNLLTQRPENVPMGLTDAQLAHKQKVEETYRARIMEILVPVLGEENVRSQVDVVMDFTESEVAVEDFDNTKTGPKTRSEVLAEDRSQRLTAEGIPGSITNTPPPPVVNTDQTGASADDALQENTTLSKRATRNYEIDKTVRYIKNPLGNITRVSVAVVINGKPGASAGTSLTRNGAGAANGANGANGASTEGNSQATADSALYGYTQAELDRLTNLVRGVVGYQEGRGDVITLVPAKFVSEEVPQYWYNDEELMTAIKIGITTLIFLIVLVTIVRPVINMLSGRTMTPKEIAALEREAAKRAKAEAEAALAAEQAAKLEEEARLAAEQANNEQQAAQDAAIQAMIPLGPDGQPMPVVLGPDGKPLLGPDGKPILASPDGRPLIGADGQPLSVASALPSTELTEAEMGMIELEEGETLEDIKAKLKPKKSSISIDMLNTANSYDDKVALIRFLVSEDSGRVATVMKNLIRPA
nr:Flagellar M-ring protein [Cupriavidus sp.]